MLFLCMANSARSIFAEALLARHGRGRFRAFSAGSAPAGRVHPRALEVLERNNFLTQDLRSKDWHEFARTGAPQMDFVFTVCDKTAGEVCPVWPGQPMTAHWGILDPVAAKGADWEIRAAFTQAFNELQNRISIFVNLPFESLDRLKLQERLDAIGRVKVADMPAPAAARK